MDSSPGVRGRRSGEKPLRYLLAGIFETKRWNTLAALGLIVAVSLTEGMAVLLLLPLLQLAGVEVQHGSLERIASPMRAMFSAAGIQPTIAAVLVAYVIVTAMEASLVRLQSVLNARVVQAYADQLRTRLYGAISRAEWLALSRIRSSDFTFALTTAIDRVSTATNQLLFAAATAAVTTIYIALAFLVSPLMSAVVLAAATLLILSQHRKVLSARAPGEQLTESTTDLYATAAEQLGGLKTAKSYGHEERHVAMFLETGREVDRAGFSLIRTYADLRWRQTVGSVIALVLILYFAVTVFHLGTAAILLLLFMFSRIVPRLATLQQSFQNIVGSLPALRTIRSLISRCERSHEQGSSVQVPIQAGQIELRGLSFAYSGNGKPLALSEIGLVIPDGKTTAIVGSSGAGKTTFADLLLGLIRPQEGVILVGGVVLDSAHLQSWRSQIGYVAQDTYLFNDTVRANLSWAKPGASQEEMEESLRQAAADEFVRLLPDGIDTVIGERGVRLSGGEKQRLSLARALLRKPGLLILDEATNALDSENEQRIYDAISSLHGEMTIVVITHRLTTIRAADLIHVLDRGRLVASGDWDSLMADSDPRFRQLCFAQGIAESKDLVLR